MLASGGTLEVESKLGEGTVFYVVLPQVTPRALILEDSEDIRKNVSATLAALGVQALTGGVKDLAPHIKSEEAHLIVIGPSAGHGQSAHIVSELKNDPDTANIPVITLISDGDAETRKRAMTTGANDVISFPSSGEALSLVFRKYFD